ncbi:3-demethylubiquinone-9 3-methyltransferase [Cognatiyoonia koreensis]|uniref:3-demethylubiquinone-9 3-methyltransferase n=1 Tax=Cognatiyoonia koreensis TaxID=364200 RepID=A0A1I0NDR7_9RHOB|nr:VOC family protein [Cognatiyoonia koreensis]SEV99107.1 3-demethylubiquinone-9 3-methyltransferase [Cognatiyoonia koreensis]
MSKIRTCLWFESRGAEAAHFYTSLIPGSAVEDDIAPDAEPLLVNFHLAGVPYLALNGGPHYKLNPAASIMVMTEDQAETDMLWKALIADGGAESQCAWCVDRFGVSWQVVPKALPATVGGPDTAGAKRATDAMMQMTKIDIATLEAAYRGD